MSEAPNPPQAPHTPNPHTGAWRWQDDDGDGGDEQGGNEHGGAAREHSGRDDGDEEGRWQRRGEREGEETERGMAAVMKGAGEREGRAVEECGGKESERR